LNCYDHLNKAESLIEENYINVNIQAIFSEKN